MFPNGNHPNNTSCFSVFSRHGMPKDADVNGAGILPFMRRGKKIFFVLGRERFVQNWRGSHRWSGFEGGRKPTESIVENAVREFHEETMGAFLKTSGDLETDLEENNYAMRIALSMRAPLTERAHVTFVKHFAWQPNVSSHFAASRRTLLAIQTLAETIKSKSLACPRRYPFVREGDRMVCGNLDFVVVSLESVVVHGTALHLEMRTASVADAVKSCSEPPRLLRIVYVASDAEHLTNYQAWFSQRRQLTRLWNSLGAQTRDYFENHVRVSRGSNGLISHIAINPDILEKSVVRLWPFEELVSVAFNSQCEDIFRPYFLVVLRQTLLRFTSGRPERFSHRRWIAHHVEHHSNASAEDPTDRSTTSPDSEREQRK